MKRSLFLICIFALAAGLLSAADLTGKWTGKFDFNGNAVPLTFDLKSDGDTITGKINGLPTPDVVIKDGKVDGNSVKFWITTEYQGNPIKLVYNGKISTEQIDFTMGTEDGAFSVSFPVKKADS